MGKRNYEAAMSRVGFMERMSAAVRDNNASIAVEFAFLMPVLILLLGGSFELSGAIQANAHLTTMVGQVALSWGDCVDNPTGTCQTEMSQYVSSNTKSEIARSLDPGQFSLNLWQVSVSGTTVSTTYGTTGLTPAATAAALAQIPGGNSGVVVIGSYFYRPRVFTVVTQPFIGNGYAFSQTAVARKT